MIESQAIYQKEDCKMLRQTPCEHEHAHEFTRTPVTETERRGKDKVFIYYDVYFCESCGCTFKIITDIEVKINYYKWI